MKLPFPLKLDKKKKAELFLALVLRDEKVDAVIFEELGGKAQVVGSHEEYFVNSIDSISIEEFLDILDKAISKAQSPLPDNTEPQKTIFGVKDEWIENDKIKKDQLLRLKRACDELGLKPVGFLMISQAVSYYLQKEEGAPLSAIFVDTGKTSITVSLIRSGKVLETKSTSVENDIPGNVDSLLREFANQETLPSRIIIFDGKKDLSQEFISHQWSKNLRFLHIPQISTLPADFPAKAVLYGVATQMGFEVLGENLPESKDESEKPPENFENLSMENFGFVKDSDVSKHQQQESINGQQEGSIDNTSKKNMSDNEEITNSPDYAIEPGNEKPSELVPKTELEETNEEKPVAKFGFPKNNIFQRISPILNKFKYNISKITGVLSVLSRFGGNKKKIVVIPATLILLTTGLTIFYFFGSKATVSLEITPKIVKQNNDITFSTDSPDNIDKGVIAGKTVSVSLDGEISTKTTGIKEVGTKAKGSITIFNNTDSTETFSEGTIVSSSNDLNFVLDDSVTVASASGDVFSGTTPGKAEVNITASEIGTQYNLPSNTKFSIGNNPSIAGKNDDPFTGGSSKEISVISEADIEKLLEELPKKLEKKGDEELAKKTSEGETLLPIVLSQTITKRNFSGDIGDEAENVTLKGTVTFNALSYNKKDLAAKSASTLKKDASENQELDENSIKVEVRDINKKSENEIEASLALEATLKPKLDKEKIIKEIAGISYSDAEEILMKTPQAAGVTISSTLSIPFIPKILPKVAENIDFIINAK